MNIRIIYQNTNKIQINELNVEIDYKIYKYKIQKY